MCLLPARSRAFLRWHRRGRVIDNPNFPRQSTKSSAPLTATTSTSTTVPQLAMHTSAGGGVGHPLSEDKLHGTASMCLGSHSECQESHAVPNDPRCFMCCWHFKPASKTVSENLLLPNHAVSSGTQMLTSWLGFWEMRIQRHCACRSVLQSAAFFDRHPTLSCSMPMLLLMLCWE